MVLKFLKILRLNLSMGHSPLFSTKVTKPINHSYFSPCCCCWVNYHIIIDLAWSTFLIILSIYFPFPCIPHRLLCSFLFMLLKFCLAHEPRSQAQQTNSAIELSSCAVCSGESNCVFTFTSRKNYYYYLAKNGQYTHTHTTKKVRWDTAHYGCYYDEQIAR